jgi:enoyl-CoA hydratase/carnithine racemase
MTQQMQDDIYIKQKGPVAELVLNRPAKRNALTEAMWANLPGLLESVAQTCRVLLVRGEGGAFASGADISEFDEIYASAARGQANSDCLAAALDALADFPHPTIAVIRGACVGGGCALALACDFRFADDTAKFAITPAKMGLLYPFNDTKRLVDLVGGSMAKDILFSARVLEGEEARSCGLVNRLCSTDDLEALVSDYATRLLDMSPRSAQFTKRMIDRVLAGQDHDTDETRDLFRAAFSSTDFKEGYRAFLEKRKPDFT